MSKMPKHNPMPSITYDKLLAKLWHHDVRGWILAGAKQEDARTIHWLAEQASSAALRIAMAKALLGEKE